MALFSECMQGCVRKVLDTADIVRGAILRQLTKASMETFCFQRLITVRD